MPADPGGVEPPLVAALYERRTAVMDRRYIYTVSWRSPSGESQT